MKVISLTQPWATLVALGGHPNPAVRAVAKRLETRSRPTKYRGPLAIHASKRFPGYAKDLVLTWSAIVDALFMSGRSYADLMYATGTEHAKLPPAKQVLPLGAILCIVDLVDCMAIIPENIPPEPERSFGDYTPGRYAWHLANVHMLPQPIPAKGMLGLWTPEPDVDDLLERFYRGVA